MDVKKEKIIFIKVRREKRYLRHFHETEGPHKTPHECVVGQLYGIHVGESFSV